MANGGGRPWRLRERGEGPYELRRATSHRLLRQVRRPSDDLDVGLELRSDEGAPVASNQRKSVGGSVAVALF